MSSNEEQTEIKRWKPELGYDIIASPSFFTFYVGPQKTPFLVHNQLFKGISDPLHILITGDMLEAQRKSAELLDTDPVTFAAVIEYAYTGFITGAACKTNGPPKEDQPGSNEEKTPFKWIFNAAWKEFLQYKSKFTEVELDWYEATVEQYFATQSSVLILYAKVATLADKWLILELKKRCLCYIWSELVQTTTWGEDWVVNALQEYLEQSDPIHDVGAIFTLCFAGLSQTFGERGEFQELLSQYPAFALALFRIISRHTNAYVA